MAIEGVGGSIVSKITELLVEPIIKQLRYMFYFNNFVQEFDKQVMSLALAFYRVQDDVDIANRNAEEIEIDVNKWLEDAKYEMQGVNRLENEKGKNGKCFTWCPKWICLFKLSKALEKKTETLRKLEENSQDFRAKVAHKAPLQDIEFLPSKEFTPSKSSNEALEQIMKALKDDNVNMIGLYGMGGVGKTTLVKEGGRRAKETQLFHEVLLATVSQNSNVTNIQDRMAESLGLKFDDVKTKEGRANRLWQRLKKVKKLLVILDDVWQNVDLKEIGIPFGDDHRGCKVLLTTRRRDICSYMQCQQKVLLHILSENEAWTLFKINAGLRDEDSNLNRVAEKVARECQGLPIALMTVGRALRDKSVVEWEVAFKELKNSHFRHMEQFGEQKNTYMCLKLSYNYLKHEETKLCFLLCCLFPEDYNIPIEDLTRYAVGYELHQDVESIEDARKQVYVAIKTLKDCCMLLGIENEEHVKMHDLVRDVAIQIGKEHGFMVKAGIGLKEWPMNNKSFEGCTIISLMGNKLAKLPEGLVCPQLKVLLFELDDDLNVPEMFFEGMKEIEVLSLKGGCLSLQSLEFSTNLQSLILIRCKCNDLIWLRKLQRLKILGLIWLSSLEELPVEIEELKELRLLDVTNCSSLGRIPMKLIGRLKKLEELLIGGYSFKGWGVVGYDSIGGINARLAELNLLSQLAVLSLKIPRVECIPRDFVFPMLLKYDIMLGDGFLKAGHPTSTILNLSDISVASLNAKTFEQLFSTVSQIGFINVQGLENIFSCDQMTSHGHGSQKDFLQRLEDVKVTGCKDIRTLFPAKWRQALNNLTGVEIENCESLEVVFELGEAGEGINEEELRLLSSLTRIKLSRLPELKCIWKGPTRHVSLRSLIHLELRSLDKLTFIFTPHLAQSLVHLETLRICECSGLKYLIREKDDAREIIPEYLGFPKLKFLSISDCDKLEYVFTVSVSPSLVHLETLWIDDCRGLNHLIREKDDEREIIPESLGFPKLKTLFIRCCDKLEYIFPVSMSTSFLNLEEMQIAVAANLKQIFYSGEGDALTRDGIMHFPQLRKLSLYGANLKLIFYSGEDAQILSLSRPKNFIAHLPSLQVLYVKGHEELGDLLAQLQGLTNLREIYITNCKGAQHLMQARSFIPNRRTNHEWWQALNNLTSVEIENCKSLEVVFELGEAGEGINEEELRLLSSLTRIKLSRLPELKYIWKGPTRHVSLRSLIHLELRSLDKLTFIFTPHLAQSLVHLETLRIRECSGLKYLIREKDDAREIIPEYLGFPKLNILSIRDCDKLEYVFTISVSPSLVHLETLWIENCRGLKHLMREKDDERKIIPESLGFPKLKTLFIRCCDKLEYVFPVSVSPSFLNLEEMQIAVVANLKQIFYSGEGDTLTRDGIIHFPQLRKLSSNSRCDFFGPKNFTAQLPSLQVLYVEGHEELGDLLAQLQGHTNLREIHINDCKGAQELIVTGHELSLLSLEKLQLWSLPNMRCIWKGLVLSHLTTLEVYRCKKLTHVFTGSMVASLIQLQFLRISNCEELEQIIAKDNDDEKDQILSGIDLQSLCFPNLCKVVIKECNKLRSLFPIAMAAGLSKLQRLEVTNSSKLLGVFGQDDDVSPVNAEKQMEFPKLLFLRLYNLPSIVCFIHGCEDLLFPRLVTRVVDKCPKLTTKFARKTNGSMSAQLEVSQSS